MEVHRCRFVDYTPATILLSCFSANGDYIVGRSNGQIEIWDPVHWSHLQTIPGSSTSSVEALVSADNRLFSIGGSTYITEWDMTTLRPKTNYDCNAGVIWCMDVNPSQTQLAVGCDDGLVVIIDIEGGVIEHSIIGQRQDLRVMLLKWLDDDHVVGGCADGRIRVWQTSKALRGRILANMRVDKSKTESTLVWSLVVLPKQGQFVLGDSTGSVKFWDIKLHTLLQSFKTHEADVLCLTTDAKGERVFSGGVDRKIHQFSLLVSKNQSKWTHSFNRLLHANDIRTLACHRDWLVLGGVERLIVVLSVEKFHDGEYKKLNVDQQLLQVVVYNQFVALFSDQLVKIWHMDGDRHRLVAKVVVKDEENITSVDFTETHLVVATINTIKVFLLTATDTKLEVTKYRDSEFNAVAAGAKHVRLVGTKLITITPDEEVYQFQINQDTITLDDEIEMPDHNLNLAQVVVEASNLRVAVLRVDGQVDVFDVNATTGTRVTKIPLARHLAFSSPTTVVVVLADGAVLEVNVDGGAKLLTPWAKAHSLVPARFALLVLDSPVQGCFVLDKKTWVYGTNYLAYFDMAVTEETKKNKKRDRNGTMVGDDNEYQGFGVTEKYRPIIKAAAISSTAMVVVERPLFLLPTTLAFDLPKIQL